MDRGNPSARGGGGGAHFAGSLEPLFGGLKRPFPTAIAFPPSEVTLRFFFGGGGLRMGVLHQPQWGWGTL